MGVSFTLMSPLSGQRSLCCLRKERACMNLCLKAVSYMRKWKYFCWKCKCRYFLCQHSWTILWIILLAAAAPRMARLFQLWCIWVILNGLEYYHQAQRSRWEHRLLLNNLKDSALLLKCNSKNTSDLIHLKWEAKCFHVAKFTLFWKCQEFQHRDTSS